jgi:hypothetical protein
MSLDGKNSSTMVGGEGEENTKTEEEEQQRQDLEEGEGSGQAAAAAAAAAAIHIQRRYRGYRLRRKVADAAVMANISWYTFSLVCSLSSSSSNKTLSFVEQFSSLCLTQLLPTCGWGRDAGGMQWMQ